MTETQQQSTSVQKASKQETVQQAASGKARLIAETLLESELASALGVPTSVVRRLRSEGEIPHVRIAHGRTIYLVESILAWLHRKEIKAGSGG